MAVERISVNAMIEEAHHAIGAYPTLVGRGIYRKSLIEMHTKRMRAILALLLRLKVELEAEDAA